MDKIDLRSDTVSWPTPEMRHAMANAAVGDDVYGDDPTVNELQRVSAEITGKEAGLFVSSGTQGNFVAMLAHCGRGQEAIIGDRQHVYTSEAGNIAQMGGIVSRILRMNDRGEMNLADIEASVRADNEHYPVSRLILVETTAGGSNGVALSLDYLAAVREIADRNGLVVHCDGARLFNAAAALNVSVSDITQYVDTVTFCLSKGLCAPVGSVLCGSKEFIHRAHRARKPIGGGMRQAGILAAAGLVALRDIAPRMADDHHHAKMMAEGLSRIPGIDICVENVHTNLIFFGLTEDVATDAPTVCQRLKDEHGILLSPRGPRSFRAVTHYWINADAVESFLDGMTAVLGSDSAETINDAKINDPYYQK
ncbi:MAG: low-specificity L-threonine aldolase [Candidatus Promineifilaceae bacterium]